MIFSSHGIFVCILASFLLNIQVSCFSVSLFTKESTALRFKYRTLSASRVSKKLRLVTKFTIHSLRAGHSSEFEQSNWDQAPAPQTHRFPQKIEVTVDPDF